MQVKSDGIKRICICQVSTLAASPLAAVHALAASSLCAVPHWSFDICLCACSLATSDQSYGIATEAVAPITGPAYSFLDKATPKAANSGPSTSLAASISG